MLYLDNAATTFPKPARIYDVMDEFNRNNAVNAGRGAYRLARTASKLITETKQLIRALVHADVNKPVVFAPSVTVAINQIVRGIKLADGDVVYVSPYEHNAVARSLHLLAKSVRIVIRELPIDVNSLEIDLEKVKYAFSREKPRAVFCTHISNVVGYILPVQEIFCEAKKYRAITVLDTAQSLGLAEVDSRRLNADFIAFAGHKTLYGPLGIGGFINISAIELSELIAGGTGSDSLNLNMPDDWESRYEAASSNIVAIAGLHAALEIIKPDELFAHEKELTNYLINELEKLKNVKMYLPRNLSHHIGIVSFSVDGIKSDDVGMILDEDYDISVRTGYHCAPFIHKYLKDEKCLGTVRIGLGQFNTVQDVDCLIGAIKDL